MTPLLPRADALRAISDAEFDVVVIGGGIVGAGVARDAARRGFRTALIERDDFAAGTSSRSSRLVHGGVRYLEHGWFHLVFEASRERRRLLDAAPHLVRPLRFTWPVYDHQRLARWEIGAGLLMYDVLAMYRNVGKHKRLAADDVLEREPALLREELKGGATYWDAATDDARLTLATALDAERAGARLLNHARVTGLTRTGRRVDGVVVQDELAGITMTLRARVVVNATGPWTSDVRTMENPAAPEAVRGTKGVHVLIPRERLGNTGALTLLHPRDQRVVFALPAGRYAMLGTTDTRTAAGPQEVRADVADMAYLLEAANHFFPRAALSEADVVSAWAGIRPLVASSKPAAPSDQSREHEIDMGTHGVINVSGGKLTTYRAMAEEIVDVVAKKLRRKRRSDTARAVLPGGDLESVQDEIDAASEVCGDAAVAANLVHAHGTEWRAIWALGDHDPRLRKRIALSSDAILAEVVHAVRFEHALTLSDVLMRRTHVAFESRDHGESTAVSVAATMAPLLGWSANDVAAAIAAFLADARRVFAIDGQPR
ncbi:MAG TPA: glycerol-3-phosphate dehydrogenase [Gemmatimonadaceae bacterium]|nr:glycerol-3-phosphate dehydrogenase [Gemmatimonadaceae bacterium]